MAEGWTKTKPDSPPCAWCAPVWTCPGKCRKKGNQVHGAQCLSLIPSNGIFWRVCNLHPSVQRGPETLGEGGGMRQDKNLKGEGGCAVKSSREPFPHHEHGRVERRRRMRRRQEHNRNRTRNRQISGTKTPLASRRTNVDTLRIVPKHRNKNQGQESHSYHTKRLGSRIKGREKIWSD